MRSYADSKLPSSWSTRRSPLCWSHKLCRRSWSGRPIRGHRRV